ncbi:MAG: hypothetical protein HY736_24885 [Verrucomicrobia bacterium]|nr:hypothetical protein [Verrucomicrobiota bacterium]
MMVVGSLISLLAKPDLFINAFKSLRRRGPARAKEDDPLQHIELPLWMSFVGVPIFSVLGVWVTHEFFGIPWLLTFISLPLIFVLTIICANSMAVAAVAAIVFEVLRIRSKNRFPISAVSVGLGVVLPP